MKTKEPQNLECLNFTICSEINRLSTEVISHKTLNQQKNMVLAEKKIIVLFSIMRLSFENEHCKIRKKTQTRTRDTLNIALIFF